METALLWNITLSHLINAPASPENSIVLVAKGLAVLSPWLVIADLSACGGFGTGAGGQAGSMFLFAGRASQQQIVKPVAAYTGQDA